MHSYLGSVYLAYCRFPYLEGSCGENPIAVTDTDDRTDILRHRHGENQSEKCRKYGKWKDGKIAESVDDTAAVASTPNASLVDRSNTNGTLFIALSNRMIMFLI